MAGDPVLMHAKNAADAAERYGVPASVILGLLKIEGGTGPDGKPVAPGDGAGPPSYGQFTYSTGKSLGIQYGDSRSEVFGVARYLSQLGYSENPTRALARYNGGGDPPPVSWTYAEKVKAAARSYLGFDDGTAAAPTTSPASSSPTSTDRGGTLARFGLTAALVLAGAALVLVGVARATGIGKSIAPIAKAAS